MPSEQPVPWEVTRRNGMAIASNGGTMVVLQDAEAGRLFVRRAIKGLSMGAAADRVLPKLNELAGELLQRMEMPAHELAARLQALAGLAHVGPPQHVEWAVVEMNGVRVYCNGAEVLVTEQDLTP
jgi:hypothetical protein